MAQFSKIRDRSTPSLAGKLTDKRERLRLLKMALLREAPPYHLSKPEAYAASLQ